MKEEIKIIPLNDVIQKLKNSYNEQELKELFGPFDIESEDLGDDFFSEEDPFSKTHESWDS